MCTHTHTQSLMNLEAKLPNKILPNNVWKKIHYSQVRFTPGMWGWFNIWKLTSVLINRLKKKSDMMLSTGAEKVFDKIEHWFMKTLSTLRVKITIHKRKTDKLDLRSFALWKTLLRGWTDTFYTGKKDFQITYMTIS